MKGKILGAQDCVLMRSIMMAKKNTEKEQGQKYLTVRTVNRVYSVCVKGR